MHRLLHRPLAHSHDTLLLIFMRQSQLPTTTTTAGEADGRTEGDAEKGLIVI